MAKRYYGTELSEELGLKVELVAPDDDRTCKVARALDGKVFAADEAPDLPLEGCDADICRCIFCAVVED